MENIRKTRIRNIIDLDFGEYHQCLRLRIERVEDILKFNATFLEKVFGEENLGELVSFLEANGLKLKDEKTYQEEILIGTEDFSARTLTILSRMGVNSIQELSNLPKNAVVRFRGLGKGGIAEIEKAFEKYNLTFKQQDKKEVDYETLIYTIMEKTDQGFNRMYLFERLKTIDEILIPMESRTHIENLELIKNILNKEEYQVICNVYGLEEQEYSINRAPSTVHRIEKEALSKLYKHLDSLKDGKRVNPYHSIYEELIDQMMGKINFVIDENQYRQLKEDLLNAMLSRDNQENLLLIRSILNEKENYTICNIYGLENGETMTQTKIAENLGVSNVHKYEFYGIRKLFAHRDVLLTGEPLVKEEINSKDIYADLSKYFKEEGMIETLDKLSAGYFEKDSRTMENIAKKSTDFIKTVVDEAIKANNMSSAEEEVDKLMGKYKVLVDRKREELHTKKEKEAFASKMREKIRDLKKYHHKEVKHSDGHSHNPFADDIEME